MLGTGLAPGAAAPAVTVDYSYGFSADMGGGPYSRDQRRFPPALAGGERDTVTFPIDAGTDLIPLPGVHAGNAINSLKDAVDEWKPDLHPLTIIQIEDSAPTRRPRPDSRSRRRRLRAAAAWSCRRPIASARSSWATSRWKTPNCSASPSTA